jgi:CheY-like chemotaxis protein
MVRKVLSVCYEECLPPSTLDFLERAGCEMKCARALGAALQFFDKLRFDLILINQTVSSSQEHLFVQLVRQKSNIPIVFVGKDTAIPPGVNACLKPPVNPEDILRAIDQLVPENRSTPDVTEQT